MACCSPAAPKQVVASVVLGLAMRNAHSPQCCLALRGALHAYQVVGPWKDWYREFRRPSNNNIYGT